MGDPPRAAGTKWQDAGVETGLNGRSFGHVGRAQPRRDTGMQRIVRFVTISALAMALTTVLAAEEKKPDATIKLSGGSVAAGVGVSWGSGTLTYKGKTHPID